MVVFNHTVLIYDSDATRKLARNVHSDYSPEGAARRLADVLGANRAAGWAAGHCAFVNVWRPVGAPINSAPLCFVRPASMAENDWMLIDLIYPDPRRHTMGLATSDAHEWVYMSRMTPDGVVAFDIYDNRGRPSAPSSTARRPT